MYEIGGEGERKQVTWYLYLLLPRTDLHFLIVPDDYRGKVLSEISVLAVHSEYHLAACYTYNLASQQEHQSHHGRTTSEEVQGKLRTSQK